MMRWMRMGRTQAGVLLALILAMGPAAMPQVATTTVADTIYRADGSAAGGTVVISWPEFSTSSGDAVSGGSVSATIGSGGA